MLTLTIHHSSSFFDHFPSRRASIPHWEASFFSFFHYPVWHPVSVGAGRLFPPPLESDTATNFDIARRSVYCPPFSVVFICLPKQWDPQDSSPMIMIDNMIKCITRTQRLRYLVFSQGESDYRVISNDNPKRVSFYFSLRTFWTGFPLFFQSLFFCVGLIVLSIAIKPRRGAVAGKNGFEKSVRQRMRFMLFGIEVCQTKKSCHGSLPLQCCLPSGIIWRPIEK